MTIGLTFRERIMYMDTNTGALKPNELPRRKQRGIKAGLVNLYAQRAGELTQRD
jgi:hypothetical protein